MAHTTSRLIEALRNAEAYPHATDRIELVETHISWVLLTGRFAYKVKKPVRFAFLDFSTLELRKHFCEDEIRLNRRLAPQLYLAVVPIGGTPSAPTIGSTPAIEYAVKMTQFPRDTTLDELLRTTTEVTAGAFRELAERIAEFHASLPPATGVPADRAARENLDELLVDTATAQRARLAPIAVWTDAQSARLEPRLRERERAGCIRECHGDLHLGNLVWIDGRIVPFDALEFDRALRSVDTLDEVAFLVMDLLTRARSDLAFAFLNRYLEITGDYAGLHVFRYYLVYRALVRAKVRALAAAQHDPGGHRAGTRPNSYSARPYLHSAERLIAPDAPLLVITRGLSGSGKTTLTGELIGRLPCIRVRSDIERKRLHGLGAAERSASGLGRKLYSARASDATYDALARAAEAALAARLSLIVDATFLERRRRVAFADIARRGAAAFIVLDCRADEAELRRRVAARHGRGDDASEADLAVLDHQLGHDEPLGKDELEAAIIVDTTERVNADRLAREIRRHAE